MTPSKNIYVLENKN